MPTRRKTNPKRTFEVQGEGFKEFSKDLSRLTGLDMPQAEKVFKNLAASAIVRVELLQSLRMTLESAVLV